MNKLIISAALLAGMVFSATAQNFNPRFPQCPEVTNQGTQSVWISGVVVGLGGQGPDATVDVQGVGKLRVQATCTHNPSGKRVTSKEFYKNFKTAAGREFLDVNINGGGLNFKRFTDRINITPEDIANFCPSGGKNWTIKDNDWVVFLSQWKLKVTPSNTNQATTVEGTVSGEECTNYNPRMVEN